MVARSLRRCGCVDHCIVTVYCAVVLQDVGGFLGSNMRALAVQALSSWDVRCDVIQLQDDKVLTD